MSTTRINRDRFGRRATEGKKSSDIESDIRDYRALRAERRRARLDHELRQTHGDSDELLRHALSWAPYGGPTEEEIFTRFGISTLRYASKIRQIVHCGGCDENQSAGLLRIYLSARWLDTNQQ